MARRQSSTPAEALKYLYGTNEEKVETVEAFIAGATEHKGSWWPDWIQWIGARSEKKVPAKARECPATGN